MPRTTAGARTTAGTRFRVRAVANAGNFNGTDGKVTTSYAGVGGTAARTLATWLKTTTVGSSVFFGYGAVTTGAKFTGLLTANSLGIGAASSNILYAPPAHLGRINDGAWHHVAMVMPASATLNGLLIYMDGVLLWKVNSSSAPTTAINTTLTTAVGVGYDPLAATIFAGALSDTQLYATALSAAQVLALYKGGGSISGASLQGWWAFSEGSGTAVADASGSGNGGTWTGTLGSQWTTGPSWSRNAAGARSAVV